MDLPGFKEVEGGGAPLRKPRPAPTRASAGSRWVTREQLRPCELWGQSLLPWASPGPVRAARCSHTYVRVALSDEGADARHRPAGARLLGAEWCQVPVSPSAPRRPRSWEHQLPACAQAPVRGAGCGVRVLSLGLGDGPCSSSGPGLQWGQVLRLSPAGVPFLSSTFWKTNAQPTSRVWVPAASGRGLPQVSPRKSASLA